MNATRRDMIGACLLGLGACAPEAARPLHTIVIRPRMSEAELRAAAGDRLRADDTLEMSAFIRPYRLVYAGCEPPLVVIDEHDREPETMFTSPRFGIHLTVLKAYLTAEEAVAETERIFQALTACNFTNSSARYRVFPRIGRETTPLTDRAAALEFLINAPRGALDRVLSFSLSHPDGRTASADLQQGAAPLFAPRNRFRIVMSLGDEFIIPPDLAPPPATQR